jgi:hypothetical protein
MHTHLALVKGETVRMRTSSTNRSARETQMVRKVQRALLTLPMIAIGAVAFVLLYAPNYRAEDDKF